MNRAEHLQWSKDRANEYINQDNTKDAFASFLSDMGKHPETANHLALDLGLTLLMSGQLSTQHQMKDWIDGFN